MRGEITSYDEVSSTGTIKGQDEKAYLFARHDIHTGSEIKVGQSVDFVPAGSTATQVVILGNTVPKSDPLESFAQNVSGTATAALNGSSYDFKTAMLQFDGRLRRQHFWISFLILFGISLFTGWIPVIGQLIALVLIWPNLAITVKRLHDMGKTGWLVLIPVIGSIVGTIIMFVGGAGAFLAAIASGDEVAATAALWGALGAIGIGSLIMLITSLGFLIWIGVTDSQPGDNAYGPNPKGL